MKEKFDINEFFSIKREIENCDSFYSTLFGLSHVEYSKEVETACVSFDSKGNILNMLINPDFWKRIDIEEKKFVILHELCHIIYEHPKRATELKLDFKLTNYASDIFINHFLDENKYINKNLFDWKKYCWIDTVFTENIQEIEKNRNFEYYYNLLKKEKKINQQELLGNHQSVDSNSKNKKNVNSSAEEMNEISETIKDIIEQNSELLDKINEFQKSNAEIKNSIKFTPKSTKNRNQNIEYKDFKELEEKPQIEKILDILIPKKSKKQFKTKETWVGQGRRYVSFLKNNPNIKLPNYYETEVNQPKSKKEVWVFIDSSGSCSDMFDTFTNIVMELIKNKDISCRGFAFGDTCEEVKTKKLKIAFNQGNDGGLDIVEEKILEIMKRKKIKYPDNVVVLTDGQLEFNTRNKLIKPQNWILLLNEKCYNLDSILPDGAKSFILEEDFFYKKNKRRLNYN